MATDYDIITVDAFEGTDAIGGGLRLSSVGAVIEEMVGEGWEFLTSTEAIQASRYDADKDERLYGKIFKVTFRRPKSFLSDPANVEMVARNRERREAQRLEGARVLASLEERWRTNESVKHEVATFWLNLNALAFLALLFVATPFLHPIFFETTVVRAWVFPDAANVSVWLLWVAVGVISYAIAYGKIADVGTFWVSAGVLGVAAKVLGSIVISTASIFVGAIVGILGAIFGSHH